MNQISFFFKALKPLSLNNIYVTGKNGRRHKSKKAVELEKHMTCELFTKKPDIFDFENKVSIHEHFLECRVIYFMPKTKLFTKKGPISKTGGDIDNFNKPIIDNCFKFFNKLDDSLICYLDAKKIISRDNNYSVMVTLIRHDMSEILDY